MKRMALLGVASYGLASRCLASLILATPGIAQRSEAKHSLAFQGPSRAKEGLMFLDILCYGKSPLLLNRMTEEQLESLRKAGGKRSKTAPRPESTRDEAEPKLYKSKKGELYLPTENIFSRLVAAGQMVRLDGKRQVSTAKSTILPAFLTLLDPYVPLLDPDNLKKTPAWEVDMRQGRNPNSGDAICIVRPRFDRWAFRLSCEMDENEISENVIRELFDKAGSRIGLGDFRPSRKGPFGRWVINSWERTKETLAAAE